MEIQMQRTLIRLPKVLEITGAKKSTWYNWMKLGLCPKPVVTGMRSVAWKSDEIDAWIQSREIR